MANGAGNETKRRKWRKVLTGSVIVVAAVVVLALALKVLFPLPSWDDFPPDGPVPGAPSELADSIAALTARKDGESGFRLLTTGIDAFAMRMAMVRNARQTVDAQYYIWEDDLSGRMLTREIIRAADRGVRVRLLIDDNPTAGLDGMWAAVASHPKIAVRIYNPLTIRKVRPLNYLFDFPRLNRRMHNKSLTVDNAASVVGGRNVGDVYFGAADERLFIDLDAFVVGPAVPAIARQFDIYWTSKSAYPAERVLAKAADGAIDRWRNPQFADTALARSYLHATDAALGKLAPDEPDDALVWAPAALYYDDPAKGLGTLPERDLLAAKIAPLIAGSKERLDLVSGYFVPAEFGTELLAGLAEKGVHTRVVTNSLQVTDVAIVHAGYSPSRVPLLAAGVELYEVRPLRADEKFKPRDLGASRFSGGGESVHAKTFAIDSRQLFVGSFNFDPRSARLNCEMGLVIESPILAQGLVEELDNRLPSASYRLSLRDGKDIEWASQKQGQVVAETAEPGTTAFSRFLIWGLSKLPIAWML